MLLNHQVGLFQQIDQERVPRKKAEHSSFVTDAVQPFEQRQGAFVVLAEFSASPALCEQAGRGGRGGSFKARVEHEGLDPLAAGPGSGEGAEQPSANDQQRRHVALPPLLPG